MFIFAYTVVFQIVYRTSATFVEHKHNTCMFWNKWKVTLINAFLKEHANIIHKNISILFKYFCWNVRSLCSLLETSFFKKTTENLQKWNLSLSLLFLMAKMLSTLNYWFEKRMVDVSRQRITFTELLSFLVFNCFRERFVQNVFDLQKWLYSTNQLHFWEDSFLLDDNGFTGLQNCCLEYLFLSDSRKNLFKSFTKEAIK